MAHTQAVSFQVLARSGLTDPSTLRFRHGRPTTPRRERILDPASGAHERSLPEPLILRWQSMPWATVSLPVAPLARVPRWNGRSRAPRMTGSPAIAACLAARYCPGSRWWMRPSYVSWGASLLPQMEIKASGVRFVLLTPGAIDDDRIKPKFGRGVYNETLRQLAERVEQIAESEQVPVFNLHRVNRLSWAGCPAFPAAGRGWHAGVAPTGGGDRGGARRLRRQAPPHLGEQRGRTRRDSHGPAHLAMDAGACPVGWQGQQIKGQP